MEKERVALDCRKFPSDLNCSIKISGTVDEVWPMAIDHIIKVHKGEDSPEFREEVKKILEKVDD